MLKTVSVDATPRRRRSHPRYRTAIGFPIRRRPSRSPSCRATPAAGFPRCRSLSRSLLASFALALALTASSTLVASPTHASAGSRLDRTERKIVKLINSFRARHGRPRVRANGRLNRAADRHSADMLAHDFFAHSSRNGTPAATRVRRSSRARSVGENIAFVGRGERRAARRVVGMWIDSPPHRAVLLNPGYRRIGVGRRAGALGSSRGDAITADFASRR